MGYMCLIGVAVSLGNLPLRTALDARLKRGRMGGNQEVKELKGGSAWRGSKAFTFFDLEKSIHIVLSEE